MVCNLTPGTVYDLLMSDSVQDHIWQRNLDVQLHMATLWLSRPLPSGLQKRSCLEAISGGSALLS